MSRTVATAVATLVDLRRVTPWLWVHWERCQYRSPAALAPFIIRWGDDLLRRSARYRRCGRKGCRLGCIAGTGTILADKGAARMRYAPWIMSSGARSQWSRWDLATSASGKAQCMSQRGALTWPSY